MQFISALSEKEFNIVFNEIYEISKFMSNQYPNFEYWFKEKVKKTIKEKEGDIIFYRKDEEIQGFVIVKNTKIEKKICTIYVKKEFRELNIGSKLIEEAIVYLGTLKPLITIPEKNIDQFKYFIKRYNWVQTSISYKYNTPEIIFNE